MSFHRTRLCTAAASLAALSLLLVSVAHAADTVTIDDFEGGNLSKWSASASPEYYRGGGTKDALTVVPSPDGQGHALKIHVSFRDPRRSEILFVTRVLDKPIERYNCVRVTFRYRLTSNAINDTNGLVFRARSTNNSFTDFPVVNGPAVKIDQWVQAEINIRAPVHPVNIYGTLFSPIKQFTFRIDDIDDRNADFDLYVDDLRVELQEQSDKPYTPQTIPFTRGNKLNAYLLRNSAATAFHFDDAIRSLDGRFDLGLFKGLHLPPTWFPATREELFRHNVIVLADVDSYVLTRQQSEWIADFVHSGGGLLFASGPNTLGGAQDFKLPIAQILPVTAEKGTSPRTVNAEPQQRMDSPVTAGIPEPLGRVISVQSVRLRPGAQTVLSVGSVAPPGWGLYSGGSADNGILETVDDAHSGQHAVRMTAKAFYRDPQTHEPKFLVLGLMFGDTPGYDGKEALPAVGGAKYRFSFWIKSTMPEAKLQTVSWTTETATPAEREYGAVSPETVKPASAWQQTSGTFTLPTNAKRFALKLTVQGIPKSNFPLGSSITVDNASITLDKDGAPNLLPNPGAEAESGEPLLVLGTYGKGRVAFLNTWPDLGQDPADTFFGSSLYDDLMRNVLLWTARLDTGLSATLSFAPPQQTVHPGDSITASTNQASARWTLTRRADAWGPEKTVSRGTGPTFSYPLPKDVSSTGTYRLRCDLDASRHLWRDVDVQCQSQTPVDLRFAFGKSAFAPGMQFSATVYRQTPAKGEVKGDIVNAEGQTVQRLGPVALNDKASLDLKIPDWPVGDYNLRVEAVDGTKVVARAAQLFSIVRPLDRATFFPIISFLGTSGGGYVLDEQGLHDRIDDLIAHGFNTIAVGGINSVIDDHPSYRYQLQNEAECYAQTKGMAVIYEYTRMNLLGHDCGSKISSFSTEFDQALDAYMAPLLASVAATPRCWSVKVMDEPFASLGSINRDAATQKAFQDRYGRPLPDGNKPPADAREAGQLAEFVSDTASTAYRKGYEFKQSQHVAPNLLLTFCSPGYGYGTPSRSIEDTFHWSRYADAIDFDVYPYFYPRSQIIRMLQVDWCFAVHREIGYALHKPIGFYVEIDDRNYPFQKNPIEASGECALTAVAQGAQYLNSFINTAFGTGTGCRQARWDHYGKVNRLLAKVGTELHTWQKPAAQVAVYFPRTQWLSDGKPFAPDYAYQLLQQTNGECDVVGESFAREHGFGNRKLLALFGVDLLPRDMAAKLLDFVRAGGTLLMDQVPSRDEDGKPLNFDRWSQTSHPLAAGKALPRKIWSFGKGHIVLLATHLNDTFEKAAESQDKPVCDGLRQEMQQILEAAGVVSHAWSSDSAVELGVRSNGTGALLIYVNHAPQTARFTVELADLGFVPRKAIDVATGHALPLKTNGVRISLALQAAARDGGMIELRW